MRAGISDVLRWLAQLKIGLCVTSTSRCLAARSGLVHMRQGASAISVWTVRNYKEWFAESTNARDRYDYLYTEKELIPWKERAEEIASKTKPHSSWPTITTWEKQPSTRWT